MRNRPAEICEFDDYPIPAYDPAIPDDERERLKAKAMKELEDVIRKTAQKEKTAS